MISLKKIIYHGSANIIEKPQYGKGNYANDYGRGFYCTESLELAKEWACSKNSDGFANEYEIDMKGLTVLNLNVPRCNILNWLAILTKHRGYWQRNSISEDAKDYLQKNYLIDIYGYDVIIGNRADDSYFSFAQDFIMGAISLQQLETAMHLGELGEQIVIKSEKAFAKLRYVGCEAANSSEYFLKKVSRDKAARKAYNDNKRSAGSKNHINETYMIDIMRSGGEKS